MTTILFHISLLIFLIFVSSNDEIDNDIEIEDYDDAIALIQDVVKV
jgi:hypothetical protein